MSDLLKRNLKNILGWRTDRKIIVLSFDDYGTIRTESKQARENMKKKGLKMLSYFDEYDALENEEDLLAMFDVLNSVKDKNGKNAILTAFALSANIDFEKVIQKGNTEYFYELLPETYKKSGAAYNGMMNLWKEGMERKFIEPQFHGREHLNLNIFKQLLSRNDKQIRINLENRSYSAIDDSVYPTMSYTAAFDFWKFEENESFKEIIKDGLNAFEKVYGFRSTLFNSPGAAENSIIHKTLKENGIKYLDQTFMKPEHMGLGKYKKVRNYTGKISKYNQLIQVRNVVFEPMVRQEIDWVPYTMQLIETAFKWKKSAIISSHRVNFSGHIDPKNRKKGLNELKKLLNSITRRWPEVEFMSATDLFHIIEK